MATKKGRPPKLTDEVLAAVPVWREMGLSVEDIAEVLGAAPGTVRSVCNMAGVSLRAPTSAALRQALTPPQWERLEHEAAERRIPVMQLVADLVGAIADDGLFDAVIDEDQAEKRTERDACCAQ